MNGAALSLGPHGRGRDIGFSQKMPSSSSSSSSMPRNWHRPIAETDVPAMLAALCWNRFISGTRVSDRDEISAADHDRIPELDACGSRLSNEATAGLWAVIVGPCCIRIPYSWQVLS